MRKLEAIKVFVRIINAYDDPEKLLTPGILYVNGGDDQVTVHWFGIGWWHWGVAFGLGYKLSKKDNPNPTPSTPYS